MQSVKVLWFEYLFWGLDILNREGDGTTSVHVINVEIKDNHEQAELGAKVILELATLVSF